MVSNSFERIKGGPGGGVACTNLYMSKLSNVVVIIRKRLLLFSL